MKVFACALIAAMAFAEDVVHDTLHDIEDAAEDAGRAIDEAIHDVEDEIEHAIEEAAEEMEDDWMTEVWEDLECWWAERTPETTCAKWERWAEEEAAMEACWEEGGEWWWDTQECLDWEAYQGKMEEQCAQEAIDYADWDYVIEWVEDDNGYGWCNWTWTGEEEWVALKRTMPITLDEPKKLQHKKAGFDAFFRSKNVTNPSLRLWKSKFD